MTQEEKTLILRDLCARLSYGVHLFTNSKNHIRLLTISHDIDYDEQYWINELYDVNEVKPYLRSISSMTEEERKELKALCEEDLSEFAGFIRAGHGLSHDGLYMFDKMRQLEWLLKNHFDYRGLIEKGLAIEVTEENNPYKRIKL